MVGTRPQQELSPRGRRLPEGSVRSLCWLGGRAFLPRGTAQGRRTQKSDGSRKKFKCEREDWGGGGVEEGKPDAAAASAKLTPSGPFRPGNVDAQDRPARPGLDPCPSPPPAGSPGSIILTLQGGLIAPRVFRGHWHQSECSQTGPRALP